MRCSGATWWWTCLNRPDDRGDVIVRPNASSAGPKECAASVIPVFYGNNKTWRIRTWEQDSISYLLLLNSLEKLWVGQSSAWLRVISGCAELDILLRLGSIHQQRANVKDLRVLQVLNWRLHDHLWGRGCTTMGHQQCNGETEMKRNDRGQLDSGINCDVFLLFLPLLLFHRVERSLAVSLRKNRRKKCCGRSDLERSEMEINLHVILDDCS